MSVTTQLPPQRVDVAHNPGLPDIYTVHLAGNDQLQSYLDPGKTGVNAVHFTFFRAAGNSLPIASASATAMAPSGATRPLKLIRFGSGHFVANSALTQGKWTFLIDATPRNGPAFSAYFSPQVAPG